MNKSLRAEATRKVIDGVWGQLKSKDRALHFDRFFFFFLNFQQWNS